MDPVSTLPKLLMTAWLLPLGSFVLLLFFGKSNRLAGLVATGAIVAACVLSFTALFGVWLPNHPLPEAAHHGPSHEEHKEDHQPKEHSVAYRAEASDTHDEASHPVDLNIDKPYYSGDWYSLAEFGSLKLTIGYYIDTLTVIMFCMVSLIATCVHIYTMGYMHDELHDFTDPEVTLSSGENLKRPGRYHRFYQYLSLFCFSMFGVVIAGNMAMVFIFWELVGICSYFLIGFYIERKSASTAANKAFIVNRVGDFGMLIGMMALWSSLGTF